jgi:hypothetical protein
MNNFREEFEQEQPYDFEHDEYCRTDRLYIKYLADRLETALEKNREYEMLIENKEK